MKIAIGPPIENGFYYDFEFPEPIREEDLERIEAEMRKELEEGREWTRQEISRDEARKRFEAEGEPYKVELVETAEGCQGDAAIMVGQEPLHRRQMSESLIEESDRFFEMPPTEGRRPGQ